MKNIIQFAVTTALLVLGNESSAAPSLYATPGVQNPNTYVFTASADGQATAYFAGSAASYISEVGLFVNGADSGVYGLSNHSAAYGDVLDFGHVNAGDTLVFVLRNVTPGGIGPWFSQANLNVDGARHVYAAAYAGDDLIPAGTYVAFEDLPGGGDFNYNDQSVVFTNVTAVTTPVPEPSAALMLGVGAAALLLARRKLS